MLVDIAMQTVLKYNMLACGSEVVVGLSGGADSVALLHFLKTVSTQFDLKLIPVHVHHGLRGDDADADAGFAQKFANSLGLTCKIVYCNIEHEAKKRGMGLEETGRLCRYEAFLSAGGKNSLIAVAHNQNDQAETVIMRLCRGAGASGLCGIPPVRDNIIRPLLYCSREEIENYCNQQGLIYCTDKTNFENDYTRNKIRNSILPLLCTQINQRTIENISKTAAILADEEDYMKKQGEFAMADAMVFRDVYKISLNCNKLLNIPAAVCKRALRHALFLTVGELRDFSNIHINLLFDMLNIASGRSLSLPGGIRALKEFENLIIYGPQANKTQVYSYILVPEKEIFIKEVNKYVKLSYNSEKKQQNCNGMYTEVFDCDNIDDIVYCRTRQPGDWLYIGGGHTKKLKDFFSDEKIPKSQRDIWPLIAFGSQILWVAGKRRASGYNTNAQTKNTVVIQIWEDI